jgi:hypothetical protein
MAWTPLGNIKGPQGNTGPAGNTGPQGPQGNTGAQGPQGNTGAQGANGAPGEKWFSGSGAPSGTLVGSIVGDWYLNSATGDVYEKTGSTSWTLQANIKGPQGNTGAAGTPGEVWYSASGAPSTATGAVGDWYINTANGDYYEKTGAAAWTLRGNLTGPQGPPGTVGTLTFTGDVTGSGSGTINLQIAANAITATEIAANAIGASEINNTQNMAWTALQTIKITDAVTNGLATIMGFYHNSSGTPTVGFGSRIELGAKSDTTVDRGQGQIATAWSIAADATRTAYMDLLCMGGAGLYGTAVIRCHGSKGVSIANTTDPGAGFVNTPSSGGFKINNVDILSGLTNSMESTAVTKSTTSTGIVMAGLGAAGSLAKLTPSRSGVVLLMISGYHQHSVAGGAVQAFLVYGTGTAPVTGAAATGTGTQIGWIGTSPTANAALPFGFMTVLNLTPGTAYWFDLQFRATIAGTAQLNGVVVDAIELK